MRVFIVLERFAWSEFFRQNRGRAFHIQGRSCLDSRLKTQERIQGYTTYKGDAAYVVNMLIM